MNKYSLASFFVVLVSVAALFSASANATPVVWYLSGVTFADGGTASGSFTYDADTNVYSTISVSTTVGSIITTPKSYDVATSSLGCNTPEVVCLINSADAANCAGKTGVTFAHVGTPLTNAGGTITLTFAREYTFENFTCSTVGEPKRSVTAGSFTSNPTTTYSVGGNVSGLTSSVTLQNNGGDDIIKTTNDGFTFTAQAEGSDYAVTVSSQPTGQTCTVTNGSGTNIATNITNVTVTCVTDVVPTYSVGGTVSGLTGTVTLYEDTFGQDLAVSANGSFAFVTELEDGVAYAVTVLAQPAGQTCSVTNGSGTIAAADVTNVTVTCVTDVIPTYSVGGTVSGLTGSLALQNNGADTLAVTADGTFTFSTELADSAAYAVTVSAQPAGQTCSVTNSSGTITTADVTDVSVACIDDAVAPPPAPMVPIPAMSEWALILLTMLLGLMVYANRRRLF